MYRLFKEFGIIKRFTQLTIKFIPISIFCKYKKGMILDLFTICVDASSSYFDNPNNFYCNKQKVFLRIIIMCVCIQNIFMELDTLVDIVPTRSSCSFQARTNPNPHHTGDVYILYVQHGEPLHYRNTIPKARVCHCVRQSGSV